MLFLTNKEKITNLILAEKEKMSKIKTSPFSIVYGREGDRLNNTKLFSYMFHAG